MKRSDLVNELDTLASKLINGCGNHGCIIKAPKGMAVNGSCRCSPRDFRRKLDDLAYVLEEENPIRWNEGNE